MVVVGAGPTGAWAAARMAAGGLRVALVERRAEDQGGAWWCNQLAPWLLEEAGVSQPAPPERVGHDQRFTMIAPLGVRRLELGPSPVIEIDMRLLGERMRREAREAGSTLLWGCEVYDVELVGGRPVALTAKRRGQGEALRLEAALFVDASGLGAALRRRVPELAWACPPPRREDLCTAAQEVREVRDPQGARAFLAQHRAGVEEFMAWMGRHGGYSVVNVCVSEDLGSMSILTGSIPTHGNPSGQQILDNFVAANPWVGPKRFGGARAIPLRRPYSRLAAPGIALLGDAACQVYAGHGSGVGVGLIAAKMLAEAVLEGRRRGEDLGSQRVLWGYCAQFHHEWGARLAAADAFRRFTQTLPPQDAEAMLGQILTPSMARDSLEQRTSRLHARELPSVVWHALRNPGACLRVAPLLARLPLFEWTAQRYPSRDAPESQAALHEYERRMEWLVGSVPRPRP